MIIVVNYYVSQMTLDKTKWQAIWRITASVPTSDKVKLNEKQYVHLFIK